MSLRDELVAAGLTVQTVTGWGSRGYQWATGQPIAVMHHHTALPVPFPVDRLYGSLLKCNINTKPDGTVWLIAARACNYSSGPGSSVVLNEVRAGTPPPANARERNLPDNTNGNPWFWNFENDHQGDGRPMPAVQHDAIVTATRVVLDHYEISSVISHAEWTWRKRDPYWNGSLRAIEVIRGALEEELMWSKGLDEAGWRLMARGGIAAGTETAVVNYWWVQRASRTDEEHRTASRNMTAAMMTKAVDRLLAPPGPGDDPTPVIAAAIAAHAANPDAHHA